MANSYYQRKATIEWQKAKTPEALRRDEKTDYTSGYFFVTLNVREHKPLLSSIVGHVDEHTHQITDEGVRLSQLGEEVQKCWQNLSAFYPNVQIIDSVIMPEHFHGLLYIECVNSVTLGQIIKGFKLGCNRAYKGLYALNTASLFSSGFNETIPVTSEEVETKKEYIHDNPRRRLLKEQLRDCFTIYRGQRSTNWTEERIVHGLRRDMFLARNPETFTATMDALRPRFLTNESGCNTLDYIGSRDLLLAPDKCSLICHRADAEHFANQSEAVLQAARDGAVVVSAFVSPREREVLNQLNAMGAPVIEIMNNGFGKTYKPWGNSFYACAEGKLLQITPWNYLYQREATISRPQCLVMNELVRLISGVEDDWWKG